MLDYQKMTNTSPRKFAPSVGYPVSQPGKVAPFLVNRKFPRKMIPVRRLADSHVNVSRMPRVGAAIPSVASHSHIACTMTEATLKHAKTIPLIRIQLYLLSIGP
jgi:hypothetical protein